MPAGIVDAVVHIDLFVIIGVEIKCKSALFEIINTLNAARSLPRLVQRGQQHGGKNRDDCYHNEQFNKGEMAFFPKERRSEAHQRHKQE